MPHRWPVLDMLLRDTLPASMPIPKLPPLGFRLALAVKFGMGTHLRHAPISDLALSVPHATRLAMETTHKDLKSEAMLFAARYCPLPQCLGTGLPAYCHCTFPCPLLVLHPRAVDTSLGKAPLGCIHFALS